MSALAKTLNEKAFKRRGWTAAGSELSSGYCPVNVVFVGTVGPRVKQLLLSQCSRCCWRSSLVLARIMWCSSVDHFALFCPDSCCLVTIVLLCHCRVVVRVVVSGCDPEVGAWSSWDA